MMNRERCIMLIDCQSFYASVEKVAHPQYADMPLVVAGDPERRVGVVLAACPIAKSYGITTAETLQSALAKCPHLVAIRPRMQTYINISLLITGTFEHFTDLVEPFSIDEQFLDLTHSLHLFNRSIHTIAEDIQNRVFLQTGVRVRIGISTTKVLAKMACDLFAKKNDTGIYYLSPLSIATDLWPRSIDHLFGVGRRMFEHFQRMGIYTIGDLANTPLPELYRKMKLRLGKKFDVQATLYWRIANGIDDSPVSIATFEARHRSISHALTLPRDYTLPEEINTILLELSDEVGGRCRHHNLLGKTVIVGCTGGDFAQPNHFSRQIQLLDPTHLSTTIFQAAKKLFYVHWDGQPVRQLSITLTNFTTNTVIQMTIDEDDKLHRLEQTIADIRHQFGRTSIMRAISYTTSGQASVRAAKIGGHYR